MISFHPVSADESLRSENERGGLLWLRIAMFVALCAAVVVIREPFIRVPLTDDEGAYAFWASIWTHDHQIYRDFNFARPQGLLVLFQIILATLGGSLVAIRAAGVIFTCLAAFAIWVFARDFFSEEAAWLSAFSYAVFSAAPRIEGFTSNAEIFTLAPLVVNAHLVWKRNWFWAGLVTAIAFQLKPSAVEGCALIAIWIVLHFRPSTWRDSIWAVATSLGGFGLGLLPCIAHGLWIGWGPFYYNLVTLRSMVYSPDVVGLPAQLARFESAVGYTLSSWSVPAVLFAVALTELPREKRRFCVAWLVAAILGMQAGFWWNWHFFMQIVPPLCFAAGYGSVSLKRTREPWLWLTALTLAFSLFLPRDARLWLKDPYSISWEIWHREEYMVSEAISKYAAETTSPNDLIYIAFGQAEIYHLSGRRPAVPNQLFYSHARYLDEEWHNVVAAITHRKATLIIYAQQPPPNRISSEEFEELILRGYTFERSFGGVRLFRRKSD